MFKLFKELINMLKNINENLKRINESINIKNATTSAKIGDLGIKVSNLTVSATELQTNIYSKKETIEQINKEYDYRKRYEECEKENDDILYLIQDYFNYKDKYQVLDLFDEINKKYKIERKVK